MPVCRLLPYSVADGPHNMAADEFLLESAAAGMASLRLYGWSAATLSLGYFQRERLRQSEPLLTGLPFVRRPSGGDALIHDQEVTYALALPAGPPWHGKAPWLRRMHNIIAAALVRLGVPAQVHSPASPSQRFTGLLCFHHHTTGDLIVAGGKVVGSAQRRQRGALMQHGAVLLTESGYAPSLPGIEELSGRRLSVEDICAAVLRQFRQETEWDLNESDWTPAERQRIEELTRTKYGSDAWNRKR